VPRLRLATRGSPLALAQAELVATALGGAEIVPTRGDAPAPNDKARFVRGVEAALLSGEADLGVHSAKDLPAGQADGLALVGVPPREDPADAYVGLATSVSALAPGARIGTSSLRRRAQLLALREDLDPVELRGNVDTRLRKLAAGDCDGVVLALAGLRRLGRGREVAFALAIDEMTPAAGQGALAIQARSGDRLAAEAAASITERSALVELTAERAAVSAFGATCNTPIGICARLADGDLAVIGFAGLADGSEWVRDRVAGDPAQPAALGEALAERMLAAGAREILARAEEEAVA
jgi:hydroxymethylbilane synthase